MPRALPNKALQRTALRAAAERHDRWADKAMKLIGSLSEQREREQLVASNVSLRTGESPLAMALQAHGIDLTTAYVLEWISEQADDLFVVLVGGDRIIRLELLRHGGADVTFDESPLSAYKPGTKPDRLRLAVALDLFASSG